MKCLQYVGTEEDKRDNVTRVSDERASQMVAHGMWKYIPKSEYKKIKGGSHA